MIPFTYERSSSLTADFSTAPGHSLPTPLPGVTLLNTGLKPSGVKRQPGTTDPAVITELWPFPDGYTVWAGTCLQSDPDRSGLNYLRPPAIQVGAGANAEVTVNLAPITVRTVSSVVPGQGLDGVTLVARPVDSTGCEPGELELTLGTTSGGGYLNAALPAGSWLVEPSAGVSCVPVEDVSSCPEETGTLVVVDAAGNTPDPNPAVVLPDMVVSVP